MCAVVFLFVIGVEEGQFVALLVECNVLEIALAGLHQRGRVACFAPYVEAGLSTIGGVVCDVVQRCAFLGKFSFTVKRSLSAFAVIIPNENTANAITIIFFIVLSYLMG